VGTSYVRGEHALGICDSCGQTFKHRELREERDHGTLRGFLVCDSCWDPDHPQNFLGHVDASDAQTIRNARPDKDAVLSRSFFGWNPLTGEEISISIGTVTFDD
jgi:hypothetical protein